MDDGQDLASIEREGKLRAFGALALIGICLLALAYLAWHFVVGDQVASRKGESVVAVRMRDDQGRVTTLKDYLGRVVVVDVWATWCPPCRASLPEVAQLQRAADDRFAVVAISVDSEGFEIVAPFFAQNPKLRLIAQVPDGPRGLAPFGHIRGIPTTFIVDRKGKVAAQWSGYYPGRAEAEVKRLLGP